MSRIQPGFLFVTPGKEVRVGSEWLSNPIFRVHDVRDGQVHYGVNGMSRKKSNYRQAEAGFLSDLKRGLKVSYNPAVHADTA